MVSSFFSLFVRRSLPACLAFIITGSPARGQDLFPLAGDPAARALLEETLARNPDLRAARERVAVSIARIAPSRSGGVWLLGAYDLLTSGAFLARLDASGRLDTAFGQGGLAFGAFARVPPVELQDGRILAGGPGRGP